MKHPANWVKSFCYAFHGLQFATAERNFRFHLFAAAGAILTGYLTGLSPIEWCLLASVVVLVLITELLNTVIETMCDWISIRPLRVIQKIKDMAAAAVLLSAIYAVVIGSLIFIPKLYPSILNLLQL